jgi:Xaa-Pro aminopeptidase
VDQFRREQNFSRGPSFPTIAGFGPNGASPHYLPSESSSLLTIDGSSTLVLDSGGHYLGKNDYNDTFLTFNYFILLDYIILYIPLYKQPKKF